ncbi:hypothetical protein LCGC14_2777330, partial [marine sediment metagenome]
RTCLLSGNNVDDYHHQHCSPFLRSEADRWFGSKATSTGSLLWICEKLNLSIVEIKRLLRLGGVNNGRAYCAVGSRNSNKKSQARVERYRASKKGRARNRRYDLSEKGRAQRRLYKAKGVSQTIAQ